MENRQSDYNKEEQLRARVAWLYYKEDYTQAEIGKALGITRARVNRMLQICRDTGVVQISINAEFSGCVDLERRLERTFGLVRGVVVPSPVREEALYNVLGAAAGDYLSQNLREGQALGIGWGRTLRAGINHIEQRVADSVKVVSLFGGLPRSATTNPYDIASLVARRLGAGECYYVTAPMFVPSAEVREMLMAQESFAHVQEGAARLDMALVGVGDLTVKATNVVLGALSHDEWKSLLEAGAVGELFNHFLDARGELVDHPLNQRVMSPPLDTLLKIPHIAVAAGGVQKTDILRAILSKGYIHALITDELTAEAVLKERQI